MNNVNTIPSILDIDKRTFKPIKGVCFDIDDTITENGKLMEKSFSALWKMKEKGLFLVAVTGRPAGHVDHIARFWPIDAVVGENGAFFCFMHNKILKKIYVGDQIEVNKKISKLWTKIQKRFPYAKLSSDQFARQFDLAIDIAEDVRPWAQDKVDAVIHFIKNEGAQSKLSSIHINSWFGSYDKSTGIKKCLSKLSKINNVELSVNNMIYIGDSPNDEPLFKIFKHSVGVRNIEKYLDQLEHFPTWLTEGHSAEGFFELALKLTN